MIIGEKSTRLSVEEEVLANLSYFEPMRFEEIILDFSSFFLEQHPHFNREELMRILDSLCKQKKIKLIKGHKNDDYQWQRIYLNSKKKKKWLFGFWRGK